MSSVLLASLSFYALLVLVGGLIGYAKAKSRASLIAGIAFAVLLGSAAGLVASGATAWGAGLGLFSALALIARFLPNFLRTKNVMPAGLVAGVGAWVVVACALTFAS
jgi:uncharacterized membrane protein (UPF0136 family)